MTPTSSRRVLSSTTDRARGREAGLGLAIAAVAALAVLAAAPAWAEDAPAKAAPDAAKLWKKNCQSCHGPDGKGDTKAGKKAKVEDLTSAEVKAKLERPKVIESIRDGIKAKDSDKMAMKAYSKKLSEEEIAVLADYAMAFK